MFELPDLPMDFQMPNLGSVPAFDLGEFALGGPGSAAGQFATMGVGAGGGGFDWAGLGKNITDWAKPVSQILGAGTSIAQIPLAIEGLNVARRGQKSLERGQELAERAAAPMIAAQEQLVPAGTQALLGGPLPEHLQMQVDQQVNQIRQQRMQQLIQAGMDQATASAMIETEMQQLKNQLTIQAAQSLLSGGQGGIQAGQVGTQAGQLGGTEMTAANQALTGANQAAYRLFSGMG